MRAVVSKVLRSSLLLVVCVLLMSAACVAQDAPFHPSTMIVEEDGAVILKADNGQFRGANAGAITHQRDPSFEIRKTLYVPEEFLTEFSSASVQVLMSPQAHKDPGQPMDSFDVIVNGHVKTIAFADMPNLTFWGETVRENRRFEWQEFPIPIEWLHAGENSIIMRKTPQEDYPADYLYVGIDESVHYGRSAFSRDGGGTWDTVNLNVPGTQGEYLIRLRLGLDSASDGAEPQSIIDVSERLVVLRTDYGNFIGSAANGITHQRDSNYRIRKIIDVPAELLANAQEAYVQIFMSPQAHKDPGGQYESFDLVVNGNVQTHHFGDMPNLTFWGPTVKEDRKYDWNQFRIPVEWLKPGENTILVYKTPSDQYLVDYLYVGIDPGAHFGKSAFSTNGGVTWRSDQLNVPGVSGEYMIRLLLVTEERDQEASLRYEPDLGFTLIDPGFLIRDYDRVGAGYEIAFYPSQIAPFTTLQVTSTTDLSNYDIQWVDATGSPLYSGEVVDVGHEVPSGLRITPRSGETSEYITRLVIRYQLPVDLSGRERQYPNIAPRIQTPEGQPIDRNPEAIVHNGKVILRNSYFSLQLSTDPVLSLDELSTAYNNWRNIIVDPSYTELFWAKVNQRDLFARDFRVVGVTSLTPRQQGVEIELVSDEYSLRGWLRLTVDETNELRMDFAWLNEGTENLRVKTAFPHLGGIQISSRDADDYYLFPVKGGIISNKSAYLNSAYGETTGFWQMIDLFYPEKGMGVYVRIDDDTGIHKHMSLTKGESVEVEYDQVGYRAPDPEISWAYDKLLVEGRQGASMAFGYQARTLQPGRKLTFPTAVLGIHEGDWHQAMERYAAWAHEVWEWQPFPSVLTGLFGSNYVQARGVLNFLTPTRFVRSSVTLHPQNEYVEISPGWWKKGETGPWGVPLDPGLVQARELLGDSYVERKRDWFTIDPVTGNMTYALNRGDYQYNPDWGGQDALKRYVDALKAAGGVVSVITYPLLVAGDTEAGRLYGERLGVMNPIWDANKRLYEGSLWTPLNPEGYVAAYASWNMCLDNEEWQDYFISTMVRLVRDLGVGIRVDEMGLSRAHDYSTKHEHIFAEEPGDLTYFQAQGEFMRKLRAAMDEVDPTLPLTAESPGNDYIARSLTGSLDYNFYHYSRVRHINPVVLNLVRFYFPEVRLFEFLVVETEDKFYEQAFWQALPLRGVPWDMETHYSEEQFTVLKQNRDAFDGPDLEPLIPTLIERVYGNRFSTEGKTVYHFYNDTGRVVSGDILEVAYEEDYHYFDLLNLREVAVTGNGTIATVIPPEKTVSIAKLPRILTSEMTETHLRLHVDVNKVGPSGLIVQVFDSDRRLVHTELAFGGVVSIPLFRLSGERFSVKLLRGDLLVDAIEVDLRVQ